MKSRRRQHRADGFKTASVATSASVRPTYQLECRFDLPTSLGLFVISFFFESASFFGCYGNGFIMMSTTPISTEVGDTNVDDDSAKAVKQLNDLAEKQHRTFEQVFLDPANAKLANATYRRSTASSPFGDELQR